MKQYKLTIINNKTKQEIVKLFEAENDKQAQLIVKLSFKIATNRKERKDFSYVLESED